MGQRGRRLSPEYVGALNLVPVEFHDEAQIVDPYHRLMAVYNDPLWNSTDEQTLRGVIDQVHDRTTELLAAMATKLGVQVTQLQILKGGYMPKYWVDNDARSQELAERALTLLRGQIALPVIVFPLPAQEAASPDEQTSQPSAS
jgi:hypothetical protein